MRAFRLALLALALAAVGILASPAATLLHAQRGSQPLPTFRSGVDLVQLDVVVLDKARQPVAGLDETNYFPILAPADKLLAGANVLAVEVHQNADTSSDVSFDLELNGESTATRPVLTIVQMAGHLMLLWDPPTAILQSAEDGRRVDIKY